MDIWSADSGSGGAGPSGLHLHHHGGLPRTLHLSPLCSLPQGSQRSLCRTVEKEVEHILYRGRHKRGKHFVVKHVAILSIIIMQSSLTKSDQKSASYSSKASIGKRKIIEAEIELRKNNFKSESVIIMNHIH